MNFESEKENSVCKFDVIVMVVLWLIDTYKVELYEYLVIEYVLALCISLGLYKAIWHVERWCQLPMLKYEILYAVL